MRLATRLRPAQVARPTRLQFAKAVAAPTPPITYPTTKLACKAWIALGANLSADSSTWAWEDISQYVRYTPGINATVHRRDQTSTAPPGSAVLTLDNTGGRFVRRNPTGPYYGKLSKRTPIRLAVNPGDGDHIRYEGYVVSWPTRWDKSGNDCTAAITCAGYLRIAAQDTNQMSALKRTILASRPAAYWTFEDGSTAATAASSVVDGQAMVIRSGTVSFANRNDLPGSAQAPNMSTCHMTGVITGASSTAWRVEISFYGFGSGTASCMRVITNSSAGNAWRFFQPNAAGDVFSVIVDDAVSGVFYGLTDTVLSTSGWGTSWHTIAITAQQSGGNVLSSMYVDGRLAATNTTAYTLGAPTTILLNQNRTGTAPGALASFAHIAVANDTTPVSYAAVYGYNGETATDRIARLCRQAGVAFFNAGASPVAMGPQPVGTWLAAVREAEAADSGLLYENGFGLGYQATWERLNVAPGFTLDFDLGQVAEPPEPADDDSYTVNRVRAANADNSEAAAQNDSSIAADGPFDRPLAVNVSADDLNDAAGWFVRLGTVDVDRWPRIDINLARSPELIPAWTALRPGTRMTLTSRPPEGPPDNINVFVEGWTEFWNGHQWRASLFTSPAEPFDVGTLVNALSDKVNVGYLDWDSCYLSAAVGSSTTSWTITCTPADISDPDAFPRDIWIGGELVTVTASTGGTTPTWTVTRSVNGVVKAQPAYPDPLSRIVLADPLILTL